MRINEDVDPRMIGMEHYHAKHGRQFSTFPPLRGGKAPVKATMLKRGHAEDPAPGYVPSRIIRHVPRRRYVRIERAA